METLPVEVIPVITQHLSGKDIAACCAVSSWWRYAFGCDEVWKLHCEVDLEEYLRTTPCRVEPKFEIPELEETTLDPIGRWRAAFMREVHLRRNLTSGNYVEEKIVDVNAPYLQDIEPVFLNNDVIVSYDETIKSIVLTDTSGDTPMIVSQINIPTHYEKIMYLFLANNYIITICTKRVVRVVEIDMKTYNLSFKSTFHACDHNRQCDFLVVDLLLHCFEQERMSLWSLESGTKLKTESYGIQDSYFDSIISNKGCEDVIVVTKEENTGLFNYRVYNFKKHCFTPFHFTGKQHYYAKITNGFLCLIVKGREINIIDYKTSEVVYCVTTLKFILSLQVLGDSFFYLYRSRKGIASFPINRDC